MQWDSFILLFFHFILFDQDLTTKQRIRFVRGFHLVARSFLTLIPHRLVRHFIYRQCCLLVFWPLCCRFSCCNTLLQFGFRDFFLACEPPFLCSPAHSTVVGFVSLCLTLLRLHSFKNTPSFHHFSTMALTQTQGAYPSVRFLEPSPSDPYLTSFTTFRSIHCI